MTDLTAPVKRKPGRPRKHQVVETIDAQAQAVVGVEAAEQEAAIAPVRERTGAVRANPGLGEDGFTLVDGDASSRLRITPAELDCLQREAWEAFDFDAPRGKTDSLGRIWAFDPDIKGGVKTVDLSVRRVGGLKFGTQIQVPAIGYQDARSTVEQIVNRLNGELP